MLAAIVSLVVMLNPFGLFFYLTPVKDQMKTRVFTGVFLRSAVISYGIVLFFYFFGEFFFMNVIKINFEAFRIFGGVIIFSFSYLYIIGGRRSMIMMKDDPDDLAAEIAMPFMVGLGSISVIILISHQLPRGQGFIAVTASLLLHFIISASFIAARENIQNKLMKKYFERTINVLVRVNGFFIGAIGVNLLITGIKNIIK